MRDDMSERDRMHPNYTLFGWILIFFAIIIVGLAIFLGAHQVAGVLSLIAVVGLLFFEGIRLITDRHSHKHLHERFNQIEDIIKKFKE